MTIRKEAFDNFIDDVTHAAAQAAARHNVVMGNRALDELNNTLTTFFENDTPTPPVQARVAKTVIELTVLHESGVALSDMPLVDVINQMDDGEFVGASRTISIEPIPDNRVRSELLMVGNDGNFFDVLLVPADGSTLDDAKTAYESLPSLENTKHYLNTALRYWNDGMITDETFGDIVQTVSTDIA